LLIFAYTHFLDDLVLVFDQVHQARLCLEAGEVGAACVLTLLMDSARLFKVISVFYFGGTERHLVVHLKFEVCLANG